MPQSSVPCLESLPGHPAPRELVGAPVPPGSAR